MKRHPTPYSLPASVRIRLSREPERESLCSYSYHDTSGPLASRALFDGGFFGPIGLFTHHTYGAGGTFRSWQQIRDDQTDDFMFAIPRSGHVRISQSGHSAVISPGACFFVATNRRCNAVWDDGNRDLTHSEWVIQVPGPLLRREVPFVDEYCAMPIDTTTGGSRVMQTLVEALLEEKDRLSRNEADRLGDVLLRTISVALLEAPEFRDVRRHRASAQKLVFDRALSFIESQLSNSDLTVDVVANHCGVSTSYLHACFSANSHRVAESIRTLRLSRCHEALCNSRLRHRSIASIARQWGFDSTTLFNHAYRARYGFAPSEARKGRVVREATSVCDAKRMKS